MISKENVEKLGLAIKPVDERVTIIVTAAYEWVQKNTTLKFDIENIEELNALPAMVKLFVIRFFDLNMLSAGVQSESIEGLSQTFTNKSLDTLIWEAANELLSGYLTYGIRFVQAENRWA